MKIPGHRRASRRFVLVADDVGLPNSGGPLGFDLVALASDVRLAHRLFIISTQSRPDLYAAGYAAAVEDLSSGYDVAVLVETRPCFAEDWARTLAALQNGGLIGPRENKQGGDSAKAKRGVACRGRSPKT